MYRSGTLDDAEVFADVTGERKDVLVRNHFMARALERVYGRTGRTWWRSRGWRSESSLPMISS
ncbi:MAG: hypothetical protein QGG50_05800 [Methanopyri archaeon]|jgi:hypothetical protein|nr:hypothetical protein [Methanopyri archaeon]